MWLAITSIFKTLITIALEIFAWLLTHPKTTIAIIVACTFGISYLYFEHTISGLNQTITADAKDKASWAVKEKIYLSNQVTEQATNSNDQNIIKALTASGSNLVKQNNDLKEANDDSDAVIKSLLDQIAKTSKADDGIVAPVLQSTIDALQKNREARNKLWGSK